MIEKYKINTFTSESVSEGHPDKICDHISDAILDEYLKYDSNSKIACECMVTKNKVIISGEINTKHKIEIENIVRKVLFEIGYVKNEYGINYNNCEILNFLHHQSEDILIGVNKGNKIGAGDQGIMFGYADNSNTLYMPLPIIVAHEILKLASYKRKTGDFKYSRPDMKTQVTIDYSTLLVDNIVISVQHDPEYDEEYFKNYIKKKIVDPVLKKFNIYKENYKILINSTGRFVIGGPYADTGLTGRKIMVDTYGGYIPHGGGAFSGKDATKVDRSGAYMARYLAKNIVSSGIAEKCLIQLAYAIGVENPVSLYIQTFNTEKVNIGKIGNWILKNIDLTPKGIIEMLDLNKPIFKNTSTYGHFGRDDLEFSWELLNLKNEFKCIK